MAELLPCTGDSELAALLSQNFRRALAPEERRLLSTLCPEP